ncbi:MULTISPECIES: HAMP domain-containing sensor histidine kinase [Mammaliicoccus]|uniref:sensor histidine kinase n=1 Tax=Mammaliicoccus TaxID=2803850 RepID=UPI000CD08129|nr:MULTISPECIES: HAMP domain-containing sensor histidine kinase [Mammaliicoccus]HBV03621.1 sensor histidine kinase [Staphylococcus sp.]MBF0794834.1 HAMP domain-containing histidine kinase [Mammaliicoccus lentus]POA04916.1 two-component sensor histidine kinase [Mammaliicoccus lentus]TFV15383.1 HAMP domain-containing histidine kinase [Mammaliicoccus lentus]SUM50877.1 sensor kinase [Mammaliicoccus lentus]
MNKRFTLKFIKYISIFFIVTMILTCIGLYVFFSKAINLMYTDLENIDETYIDSAISKSKNTYELNKDLTQKLKENNAKLYIIDDKANVSYPKNHGNLKKKLIGNINNTMTVPYRKHLHVAIVFPSNSNLTIKNQGDINTKKLINSNFIEGYNRYNIGIENNNLKFIEKPFHKKVSYVSEIGEADKKLLISSLLVTLLLFAINLIFVILLALIISKRISNPLFFYTEWIENLSKGKLFKPSSKHHNKKNKKLFKELNDSVETLSDQLMQNKIYHNQINYYKEKWLSQISHDLKSPLTTIYGYSRLLSNESNESTKYAILISEKAAYMTELINSLNQNFKYETEQMGINKEAFDVIETTNQLINSFQYDKLTIINNLENPTFYGNKLYFERMIMNLIDNSIDHNKINPNIEITISYKNEVLTIDYRDDGVGISKAIEEKALHSTHTKKDNEKEHGIGFTIIMDSIHFHNGTFQSLPIEKGVHFRIKLYE